MKNLTKKEFMDYPTGLRFGVIYSDEPTKIQECVKLSGSIHWLRWNNLTEDLLEENGEDCEQLSEGVNDDGSFIPTYCVEPVTGQFVQI